MGDRLDVVAASNGALLAADDPPPVIIDNPGGVSPFLLIGDHAGKAIPRALGTLGLGDAERVRHIAWDIGIAALGQALSSSLDAVFVRQHYSRLVIDCNRAPGAADAIPEVSDGTGIPGNRGLDEAARRRRVDAIHTPYQQAVAAAIAQRRGRPRVLAALHSFTPAMNGLARPWEVGVLYGGGDASFAKAMLTALKAIPALTVGDNEPYRMDETDYTVPRHAFAAGMPYVEIEVRQDLLGDADGVERWRTVLRGAFEAAARIGDLL